MWSVYKTFKIYITSSRNRILNKIMPRSLKFRQFETKNISNSHMYEVITFQIDSKFVLKQPKHE